MLIPEEYRPSNPDPDEDHDGSIRILNQNQVVPQDAFGQSDTGCARQSGTDFRRHGQHHQGNGSRMAKVGRETQLATIGVSGHHDHQDFRNSHPKLGVGVE